MNPRLRSMVIDGDRTILVLDRLPVSPTPGDDQRWNEAAKRMGASGGMTYGGSIDLPDDPQPEGLTIHADELAALRRLAEVVAGVPGAEYRPDDRAALNLLIERAEQ